MKKITKYAFFFTIFIVMILFKNTNAQTLSWARNWNSTSQQIDKAYAVTTDASGNVYTTGVANESSYRYIETIKYNSTGTQQWATAYPTSQTSGMNYGLAIAVDSKGNVWVAGSTYDATYYNDLTLIKYSPGGAVQTGSGYPKRYHDASGMSNWVRGTCIAVYDSNNVYVAGSTFDGTYWKLTVLKDNLNNANWGWSNAPYTYIGSTTIGEASDLKINANNTALYVCGTIGTGTQGKNMLTAKLNPSTGAASWATAYNSSNTNDDVASALAFDGDGYVYVAGYTNTNSAQSKDAVLLRYNSTGSIQTGYPVVYNSSNGYDDWWSDISVGNKVPQGYYPVYVGGTTTDSLSSGEVVDQDYLLGAYRSTTGASYWSPNPITYNGSHASPEQSGTDQGWAVDYEPTTNRIYISGRSDETTTRTNITTVGYNAATGAKVWGAYSYDYNYDTQIGADDIFWKYSLVTKYSAAYCIDDIFVVGESYVATHSFDFLTLKYDCPSCTPCYGPIGEKLANTSDEVQTGLYPNPFSIETILYIDPELPLNNASLLIFDNTGKVVRTNTNINSDGLIIKRDNLNSGIYFYQFINNGKILSSGKLMIID